MYDYAQLYLRGARFFRMRVYTNAKRLFRRIRTSQLRFEVLSTLDTFVITI